jgi:hypothetical protein
MYPVKRLAEFVSATVIRNFTVTILRYERLGLQGC